MSVMAAAILQTPPKKINCTVLDLAVSRSFSILVESVFCNFLCTTDDFIIANKTANDRRRRQHGRYPERGSVCEQDKKGLSGLGFSLFTTPPSSLCKCRSIIDCDAQKI
jgi:hypothetical protein